VLILDCQTADPKKADRREDDENIHTNLRVHKIFSYHLSQDLEFSLSIAFGNPLVGSRVDKVGKYTARPEMLALR
jgi:hypothetical protein